MPLFDIGDKSSIADDSAMLKKSKTRSKTVTTTKSNSSGNIANKIKTLVAMVESKLGKFVDETLIIQDEQTLSDYIDACLTEGICGIDTETTGLDPMLDELVGVGIYTPGHKTAYIPINHISYVTGQKAKNQLPAELVGKYLSKLQDCVNRPFCDIDMFNAPFDIRVLIHGVGVRLKCTHDAYLGARCLNENEPVNKLKPLHKKYVLRGEDDAFSFGDLFTPKLFQMCPIKTAALYAAHDPKITYEYAEYQRNIFETRENLKDVRWVFENIEMPVIDVVVDMEDTGIAFDMQYNQKLKEKYHALLDEKEANFHKLCDMYKDEIEEYKKSGVTMYLHKDGTLDDKKLNDEDKQIKKTTLDDPINIQSVPQLQSLIYVIAKTPPVKEKGNFLVSTGEEVLKKIKSPIADAILEYRSFSTLVSTFIDKMPECVNPNDGRIHCKFNQYGADTGRFSSQDPNMQNIPSHNKDIRKMFKATSREYIVSTNDDVLELERFTEVETPTGWKYSDTLHSGDLLLITDDDGEAEYEIDNVEVLADKVVIRLYSPS